MNKNIFSIAFGKFVSIAYSKDGEFLLIEDKNHNSLFDYSISIDNNIIDVHEILSLIANGIPNNKEYNIKYTNENYVFQYRNSKELRLDNILEIFFNKIKNIVQESIKVQLKDAFIVFEKDIPNNLKIIIKTVGLLSEINIENIIDLTSSLKYYLEFRKIVFPNYFCVFVKIDEFIMFSVFKDKKKIYKAYLLEECFEDNENIDNREDYLTLNKNNNVKYFEKYLNNINKQINSDIGKQDFDIKEIYIFKRINNSKLLKFICYGALFSKNYPLLLECKIILKFIDYKEKENLISKIVFLDMEYSISKPSINLIIEDTIPYNGCFYKKVNIKMKKENLIYDDNNILITLYFNESNYFYALINTLFSNSQEIIFYKNFPKIMLSNQIINYEEKFEKDSDLKRINLINIDKSLKIEGIDYKTIWEILDECKNNLIIFDSKLNLLSYYNKSATTNIESLIDTERKLEVISLLNISEIIKSNLSIEDINDKYKNEIINVTGNLRTLYVTNCIKKDYNLMDENDILIMKSYYIINLFDKIFQFSEHLNHKVDIKYGIFKQIFTNLEAFEQKCKKINNKHIELLLFVSACIALSKYAENEEKIKETENMEELLDLIDFSEDSIYKDALDKNKEFIKNLRKSSFLFNYLLQFNSANSNINESNNYKSKKIKANMISMITINQLKYDLYKNLPKYAIRIFYNSFDDYATTILNTSITLFNEINIFGKKLSNNELSIKEDPYYKKRVCLSIIIKHERFCHLKKIFNKNEFDYLNSPLGYLILDSNEIQAFHDKIYKDKGEIGESFEKLITNDRRELITCLFNINDIDMKTIYNNEIWMKESNNDLIKELEKITGIGKSNNSINNITLKNKNGSPTKLKKFSLNEDIKSKPYNEVEASNNNIIEGFININNNKMKKEEFEFLKRIHNNLDDKTVKLTHTFKENTLVTKSLKIWEKRKNMNQNNNK